MGARGRTSSSRLRPGHIRVRWRPNQARNHHRTTHSAAAGPVPGASCALSASLPYRRGHSGSRSAARGHPESKQLGQDLNFNLITLEPQLSLRRPFPRHFRSDSQGCRNCRGPQSPPLPSFHVTRRAAGRWEAINPSVRGVFLTFPVVTVTKPSKCAGSHCCWKARRGCAVTSADRPSPVGGAGRRGSPSAAITEAGSGDCPHKDPSLQSPPNLPE